jgi:hypothetical protein
MCRALTGVFASTVSVAQSYVGALSTTLEQRTQRVASLNAVMAVGYVCGPCIGGALHGIAAMVRPRTSGKAHAVCRWQNGCAHSGVRRPVRCSSTALLQAPFIAAGLVTLLAAAAAICTLPPAPVPKPSSALQSAQADRVQDMRVQEQQVSFDASAEAPLDLAEGWVASAPAAVKHRRRLARQARTDPAIVLLLASTLLGQGAATGYAVRLQGPLCSALVLRALAGPTL